MYTVNSPCNHFAFHRLILLELQFHTYMISEALIRLTDRLSMTKKGNLNTFLLLLACIC